MRAAESVDRVPLSERFPSPSYVEMCRPTMEVKSVLDINWGQLVAEGRDTLSIDAEGSFVGTGAIHPSDEVIEHFEDARREGIRRIAIQTNLMMNNEPAVIKAAWWANQIGADLVTSPRNFAERKPNPSMVFLEGAHFGMTPDEVQQRTVRIGDKLTADVLAANLAGIPSIYIADPVGDFELLGDKLFRRPYERMLHNRMRHTDATPSAPPTFPDDFTDDPEYKNRRVPDKLLPLTEKIAHVGLGPQLALSEKMQMFIDDRMAQVLPGVRLKQQARDMVPEPIEALYDEFVRNYGDVAADVATMSRGPLGVEEYIALSDGHPIKALFLKMAAGATDKIDGTLGKGYRKRNPDAQRTRIGNVEDLLDKFEAVASEKGMVNAGQLSDIQYEMRTSRDVLMTAIRYFYSRTGIDTSAIWSGKASTTAAFVFDGVNMAFGRRPVLNALVTTGKLASAAHTIKEYERRRRELPELHHVRDLMLESQR